MPSKPAREIYHEVEGEMEHHITPPTLHAIKALLSELAPEPGVDCACPIAGPLQMSAQCLL